MTFPLWGKVIDFQLINRKKEFFSFRQVCKSVGESSFSSLARAESPHTLGCLKKKVILSKFCLKTMKDNPGFTRGVFDKGKDRIFCEQADRVFVKYSCKGKKQSSLCADKDLTCDFLKSEFARNMKLVKSSVVDHRYNNENWISCDFIRSDWDGETVI